MNSDLNQQNVDQLDRLAQNERNGLRLRITASALSDRKIMDSNSIIYPFDREYIETRFAPEPPSLKLYTATFYVRAYPDGTIEVRGAAFDPQHMETMLHDEYGYDIVIESIQEKAS